MPRPKNRIIDADLDDDFEVDPTEFAEAEDEREFGPEDIGDGEFTTEDVSDQMRSLNEKQAAAVTNSRRRGQAPAGPQRSRQTATQEATKARAPTRTRPLEWKPTETLAAPPPQPGMEGRWVRYRIGNEEDLKNFSQRRRGGWVPRQLSTVPQGYFPPTIKHAQLGEVIAVGDLIYCERPAEIGKAQHRYYRDKLKRQTLAGQRHVKRVERPDHPIDVQDQHERPSVGYGKKRRVSVQADE